MKFEMEREFNFQNPVNLFFLGAKNDGAGGFFKGIGKGLIGVVARPVGGVVDMASSTFDGLKRFVTCLNNMIYQFYFRFFINNDYEKIFS